MKPKLKGLTGMTSTFPSHKAGQPRIVNPAVVTLMKGITRHRNADTAEESRTPKTRVGRVGRAGASAPWSAVASYHWRLERRAQPSRRGLSCTAAFTLTELLVAVTILAFVVTGVVAANIFGLKMFKISHTKLLASDGARKTIGKLSDEVRNANGAYVGNVSNGTFYALSDGAIQLGASMLIYPSTNHSQFILYYLNAADKTLRRSTSSSNSTMVVARSITNTAVFTAQDCYGNVLTNSSQNNRTFHIALEFYQPKFQGLVADSFKLESSVTRRLK